MEVSRAYERVLELDSKQRHGQFHAPSTLLPKESPGYILEEAEGAPASSEHGGEIRNPHVLARI